MIALAVFVPLIWMAYVWWRSRRKVLIGVTSEVLTVSTVPGQTFPLAGVQLGSWATMGVALHLQSGTHRFVLGGRDSGIGLRLAEEFGLTPHLEDRAGRQVGR